MKNNIIIILFLSSVTYLFVSNRIISNSNNISLITPDARIDIMENGTIQMEALDSIRFLASEKSSIKTDSLSIQVSEFSKQSSSNIEFNSNTSSLIGNTIIDINAERLQIN